MSDTKYIHLVESASTLRSHTLQKRLSEHTSPDSRALWARELDIVNKHITVDKDLVDEAAKAYEDLGNLLVEKLNWEKDAITVSPQGSTSTQTLIAAPTSEKFDIDAVCQVDIARIHAEDPMAFFEEVGRALESKNAEEKNRCWRVHYTGKRFYIDFTPAVPLAAVPDNVRNAVRYRPVSKYAATALAVVDRPSKQWKTSNPAGMVAWITEQAGRQLLVQVTLENVIVAKRGDVEPVPHQEVPLSDTLRVAIRLFKRHRDMAVKRNLVIAEYSPISIIITTLLTQCYEGLADEGRRYLHPIELLADLVELLPNMIESRNGEYWIANPTVDGENFAERWNGDNSQRINAFKGWCFLLAKDLAHILSSVNPSEVRERVQETFGCVGAGGPTAGPGPAGWLTSAAPTVVSPVRPTRGLA